MGPKMPDAFTFRIRAYAKKHRWSPRQIAQCIIAKEYMTGSMRWSKEAEAVYKLVAEKPEAFAEAIDVMFSVGHIRLQEDEGKLILVAGEGT